MAEDLLDMNDSDANAPVPQPEIPRSSGIRPPARCGWTPC
jgi:hypothetical protein